MNNQILSLVLDLEKAKQAEVDAKEERLKIESLLIAEIPNEKLEGSVSVSDDNFSISVTNGVTRTIDWERMQSLNDDLPDHLKLIDIKQSINLKNLRTIEQTAGERFKKGLSEAITIKPKKVSIAFKRKEVK